MNDGDVVKRNGNYFVVKHDKRGNYYTALLLGNARVTAWHRTTLKHIKEHYTKVDNYEGKGLNLK